VSSRLRYILCLGGAVALLAPAAATALPSLSANPANKLLARGIDPMHYDPATHCTGKDTPGALALLAWLERNARGVSWGIYRCEMWAKHSASLHSEGRAIDWHPASAADARALIRLLLAPDRAGNPVARARRMGIQGLIYDCQAWWGSPDGQLGDYSYCYGKNGKRKKNLDPTQAHMNHVHIELNKRGAAKKTTFWNRSISYPVDAPPAQVPSPAPTPEPQAPVTPPAPATPPAPTWDPSTNPYTDPNQP
jgi:hypothetical protein